MSKSMMGCRYTDERNSQIIVYLLKAHNIKWVVASPGMTNVCLVSSLQSDNYFKIISAPDERSAAYIACGIAQVRGETVVLSCTGATASRNYYPGLTEAYYSKLPILVITSSRRTDRIGHNFDQVTDRTLLARDVAKISVTAPYIRDAEDEWACEIAVNRAILEVRHHGMGPVHINLETMYSPNRNIIELPKARTIFRFEKGGNLPKIRADRVAIVVGLHSQWTKELTHSVECFCEKYNGIVLCDQISNYSGKYKIFPNLMAFQINNDFCYKKVDLLISIGEISSSDYGIVTDAVWRVSTDGEIRDTFWKLRNVFEMEEIEFFNSYADLEYVKNTEFYEMCKKEEEDLYKQIPNLPFSNVWIAQNTAHRIPGNAILHLGIRNSLRSFNYFDTSESVLCYSNTGGFGIDGSLSTILGNSIVDRDRLCFCVLGDLAFFYDMNSLGNRYVGKNLRILLINNGTGMEMQFSGYLADMVGADKDPYIAASGHYGNQSCDLVRHYAEDLGFRYICASSKEEYFLYLDEFVSADRLEQSLIFEVFVNKDDENHAWNMLKRIHSQKTAGIRDEAFVMPEKFRGKKNVVLFGAGKNLLNNLCYLKIDSFNYLVCDNDENKWGKEVAPEMNCISTDELYKMDDPIVIVTTMSPSITMQIVNQLKDNEITCVDHISNWVNYI